MSFEEEFDKIIRQKSEEMEYPFDEKNWESAKAMIASDRKAARLLNLKKVLKPALALTGIAAAVFLTLIYVDLDKPQSNLIGEQKTKNSSLPNTTSTNSNSTKINSKELFTAKASVQNEKQTQAMAVSPIAKENKSNGPAFENSVSEIVAETNTDPMNAASGQAANEALANNSGEKALVISSVAAIGQDEVTTAALPLNEEAAKSQTALVEEEAIETAETGASESQLSVDHLYGLTLSLPDESSNKSVEVKSDIILIKYDDAYFKPKRKTHYMNVEAGMAYLTGWNTTSGNDGKGFDYFGGINYGIYLSNKLTVGIGAQVYNVAHMNDSYYSSSHKEYDFGSTTIYTVVTCTQLYYAAIPLKINYAINKFNKIGLGFNAAYAFNSNVNTESYYYSDAQKVQNTSSSGEGIYDGMNQYNYMLTAQYSWRFAKRFGLNVEAMYGLTDLFKNNTETSNSEKSTGIRFSLSYTMFDK